MRPETIRSTIYCGTYRNIGQPSAVLSPGLNNWDMALLKDKKDTQLTEQMKLQFRAEFFNVFNHAQFNAAQSNINSATFGSVLSAQPSRIGQLSLKLLF